MNNSRMDFAIHILQTAPKQGKFNLWYWMELRDKERKRLRRGDRVALNGCGTAGCAMGWIASDPSVVKEGLYLEVTDAADGIVVPAYRGNRELEAAAAYFGISRDTAELLFYATTYRFEDCTEPQRVIERMELLLAAGEPQFLEIMRDARIIYE